MFDIDFQAIDGPGEWFFYQNSRFDQKSSEWVFDEPEKDAKVRIRSMRALVQEKLAKREKVAEHVLNPKTRAMERISYYKEQPVDQAQKEADDIWDYVITGIEGFKNKATGEIIACTRENKLKLMKIPAFDRFIGRCLRILEGAEEQVEKNL